MAIQSFFEDMVIDTPEAAANQTALFKSGVGWKRGDTVIMYVGADDESVRRLVEKYSSGSGIRQNEHNRTDSGKGPNRITKPGV